MNTLRGWITTTFLAAALGLGTSTVNAGIIVGNLTSDSKKVPCTNTTEKIDWGIIVGNLTGIIVGNFTGIIVGNVSDTPNENCGIIVGN